MFDIELFLLALGFYTRLPCPKALNYGRLPQAGIYLPVIGWLIGGLTALCFYLADFIWPQPVAVILALTAGLLLTGAFHEDGFADVCDGFGGGYGKEGILDIMKDPHTGVYGALGLIVLISIKVIALSGLTQASLVAPVLLAGHSLSRCMPLFIMYRYQYGRAVNSKSAHAVFKPSAAQLLFAGTAGLLPLIFLPASISLIVPILSLINGLLGRYFHRHIGGYTGDCLGASQQVAETVFYLGASALWTST